MSSLRSKKEVVGETVVGEVEGLSRQQSAKRMEITDLYNIVCVSQILQGNVESACGLDFKRGNLGPGKGAVHIDGNAQIDRIKLRRVSPPEIKHLLGKQS